MAELKTQKNDASVQAFLERIEDERRREDAIALLALMQEVSGEAPAMWGDAIIGFGNRHYRYASGHEGDTFVVGFSPRKQNFTLYLSGYLEKYAGLLERLGKHKTGKGCLYIKKLADVDTEVLRDLLRQAASTPASNP